MDSTVDAFMQQIVSNNRERQLQFGKLLEVAVEKADNLIAEQKQKEAAEAKDAPQQKGKRRRGQYKQESLTPTDLDTEAHEEKVCRAFLLFEMLNMICALRNGSASSQESAEVGKIIEAAKLFAAIAEEHSGLWAPFDSKAAGMLTFQFDSIVQALTDQIKMLLLPMPRSVLAVTGRLTTIPFDSNVAAQHLACGYLHLA
jgi:hypothetical protein